MTAGPPTISDLLEGDLHVVPATSFHRLTEAEFGMPGLVAIESVGPFVELAKVGPFITIHDSFMEPGLGIGHHPHRGNERLFYIVRGEIRHDDALNGIRGIMGEGDLARLTEGERGMLHKEWNGRDDIATHAFILVYTPDVEPPIPFASFDALRAAEAPREPESAGVETIQLIGGDSTFRANSSALTTFFDSSLQPGAALDIEVPPNHGCIVYPLEGTIRVEAGSREPVSLPATSSVHPEGPDAMAIAWSDSTARLLRVTAENSTGRVLRIGFERRGDDLVLHRPWAASR
jgi:redox-sensitive bicupin YhaK (pirin superfamily)